MAEWLWHYPSRAGSGPFQMAADEFLLERACGGAASFRLYTWSPATLSLGYFQSHTERLRHPDAAAGPWVRRMTGGGAIHHGTDLTYALALPAHLARKRTHADWHCGLHRLMTTLLAEAGIEARVQGGTRPSPGQLDFLCFTVPQPGDVLLADRKIIGGAARARHGAILQHGSIYDPAREPLRDRLAPTLAEWLGLELKEAEWQPDDLRQIETLAAEKYAQVQWNEKR